METIMTVPFWGMIHHLLFLLQLSVTVLMYLQCRGMWFSRELSPHQESSNCGPRAKSGPPVCSVQTPELTIFPLLSDLLKIKRELILHDTWKLYEIKVSFPTNKVWAHSHAHSFAPCLWLLSCSGGRIEQLWSRGYGAQSLSYSFPGPLEKGFAHSARGTESWAASNQWYNSTKLPWSCMTPKSHSSTEGMAPCKWGASELSSSLSCCIVTMQLGDRDSKKATLWGWGSSRRGREGI